MEGEPVGGVGEGIRKVEICLVCGHDLKAVIIKREVTGRAEETEGNVVEGVSVGEIVGVASESVAGGCGGSGGWSENETRIYQWFLKWFKVTLVAKHMKTRKIRFGHEWRRDKDRFPFCGGCKAELEVVVEIQRQVEELERLISKGMGNVREKMERKEGIFWEKGVYNRDSRYRKVRQRIVRNYGLMNPRVKETYVKERSSIRNRKGVSRLDPGGPIEDNPGLLSEEQLLRELQENEASGSGAPRVKQEVDPLEHNLDDDHWDDDYFEDHSSVMEACSTTEALEQTGGTKAKKVKKAPVKKRAPVVSADAKLVENSLPDTDSTPTGSRPKRQSTLKRSYLVEDLMEEEDEDKNPPPSKSTPYKKKRKPKDADWSLNANSEASGGSGSDSELEPMTDETRHKILVDPTTGTLTYKDCQFTKISGTQDKYQCGVCQEPVLRKGSRIQRHYWGRHTTRFQCNHCNYVGSTSSLLKKHIHIVHLGIKREHRVIECPICGRPNKGTTHLKNHMWTHFGPEERKQAMERNDPCVPYMEKKRHQCDQCGATFGTTFNLKNHRLTHLPEELKEARKELCPECGGTYADLKHHYKRNHTDQGAIHVCLEPGCGKGFKSAGELTIHKKTHRKDKPYKCNLCPRAFINPQNYKLHMDLHSGIRPWKCNQCDSAFTRKSHLERHVQHYHVEGSTAKRKPYMRGCTQIGNEITKGELQKQGKYLPPSALATWALGREPTSHFPPGMHPQMNQEDGEQKFNMPS